MKSRGLESVEMSNVHMTVCDVDSLEVSCPLLTAEEVYQPQTRCLAPGHQTADTRLPLLHLIPATHHWPLHTDHYTLSTTHCPLHTVHCPVHTDHYTQLSFTLNTIHYILVSFQYTHLPLSNTHWPMTITHWPLSSSHCPWLTIHWPLQTLTSVHYTLTTKLTDQTQQLLEKTTINMCVTSITIPLILLWHRWLYKRFLISHLCDSHETSEVKLS